jgi:hypothetical protein
VTETPVGPAKESVLVIYAMLFAIAIPFGPYNLKDPVFGVLTMQLVKPPETASKAQRVTVFALGKTAVAEFVTYA